MQYVSVVIKDSRSNVWSNPSFERTSEAAVRDFAILVTDGKSLPSLYPADFDLWRIGDYDDATGVFTSCQPEHLANGNDVRNSTKTEWK